MTDPEEQFAEALDLFRRGETEEAEARLRAVLLSAPGHAPSLNLLALIVGRAGRDAECIDLLERAIAHGTPEQAVASELLLAVAHGRAGRAAAAEAAYRRVLQAQPASFEAAFRLGVLLHEQGRHDEALPLLQTATAAAPHPAGHRALAAAHHAAGDLETAAAHAGRALATAPNDPQVVRTHPPASRASLGLPPDAVVYWCGQSLYKYLPAGDTVFAGIAARVPDCRFVFVEFPGNPALTGRFRDRLAAAFAARGLNAERFCVFLPRMPAAAFRAAMGCADVVLDSIGWSGCNSLCDALAHGLPVVSTPGQTMRSRHGAAILRQIGLGELVCPTLDAYVELAVELGRDPQARRSVREAVLQGLPRLNDATAIAALEQHICEAVGARA